MFYNNIKAIENKNTFSVKQITKIKKISRQSCLYINNND